MGRGIPGYWAAHLLPLGQKPTGALPASSCAATHAHITIQASSVGQHSAVQEPQPPQCLHGLEKNPNGRRQNAVRPRPGPTAGSRQRRPARRCRRLSMPRRRPTRLGQAGRRTLPALRPRSRHRSLRRHRISPPHGGQNDGRTERQLHPAGQRRLPNMATL